MSDEWMDLLLPRGVTSVQVPHTDVAIPEDAEDGAFIGVDSCVIALPDGQNEIKHDCGHHRVRVIRGS